VWLITIFRLFLTLNIVHLRVRDSWHQLG
jgi:hypothetical protein